MAFTTVKLSLGPLLGRDFRIEELREPRIIGHVLEIGIVSRLEAIRAIQLDGFIQIAQTVLGAIGEAIQQSQTVEGKVGLSVLLQNLFHVAARLVIRAGVHQGDGIVVVLACRLKGGSATL